MPTVFYDMEFIDFMLLREGWIHKVNIHEFIVRKQTILIAMSLGVKLDQLEKNWPDPFNPFKGKKMVTYKGQVMSEYQMKTLIRLKQEGNKRKQEKKQK